MTAIRIPDFALVVLIGSSGAGKSTFARAHFEPTEVVSSDTCRGLVSDDENSLEATSDAFSVLHFIVDRRLSRRRLTVVDATNVRRADRKPLIELARRHHALPVAVVLNPGEAVCHERNKDRPDRQFGPHVVRNQTREIRRGLRGLAREGFRSIYELRSADEIAGASVERERLWTDRRDETGPFDIVGDVHGCADELEALLTELGYRVEAAGEGANRAYDVTPPAGRKAVFLGDLVDRGPRTPDVLRLVMSMVEAGRALCVLGNHDAKMLRWLDGRNVKATHGLAQTAEQMSGETKEFRRTVRGFVDGLVSHYILDGGRLAVAHAGIRAEMQGRASSAIRAFCLYGETTGETDEFGLPVRHDWAADYRGRAKVVYGHTPVPDAQWLNNTICIDTGCVFGGKLTALRYPELELVSVPAARVYAEPIRPLEARAETVPGLTAQQEADDVLDFEDVSGKRALSTALMNRITVHEENSAAAIEVMSRFAVHPKWLVYLPPTMSPSATSAAEGLLEHPAEALAYFRGEGVARVVCQEKHMGSRAVVVTCRDADAARRRFGVTSGETGMVYTRTGRAFFPDGETTESVLARLRAAIDRAGLWETLDTDWVCIDAEIMPWSAKARALITGQYAPVGAAARIGLAALDHALAGAAARGVAVDGLRADVAMRREQADLFARTYAGYCWEVGSIDDLRIAPFHLLASEGAVHMDRDHLWHMATLAALASDDDPVLVATAHREVTLDDDDAVADLLAWWSNLTARGGEGMVVKPRDFVVRGGRGLVQPALKCRGKNYLRIIYGPEYDAPANLDRLRQRGLGRKRSLAVREFALGHEALRRFVAREPLRRVHECVFAILALESEPVDPRL